MVEEEYILAKLVVYDILCRNSCGKMVMMKYATEEPLHVTEGIPIPEEYEISSPTVFPFNHETALLWSLLGVRVAGFMVS